MKKILSMIFALMAIAIGAWAQTGTPYAVLCTDNHTLYFTVSSTEIAAGDTFTPAAGGAAQTVSRVWSGTQVTAGRPWSNSSSIRTDIHTVVFEPSFADVRPTMLYDWFYYCENLGSISGMEHLNTSQATLMSGMFQNCSSLTEIDLSHFDVGQVTKMSYMFAGCKQLQQLDLSGWQAPNLTEMTGAFSGCSALQTVNLEGFYAPKLRNIGNLFYNCGNLMSADLSAFTTGAVSNVSEMFENCTALQTVRFADDFDVSGVSQFSYMFYHCASLQSIDLSKFHPDEVTTLANMFDGCAALQTVSLGGLCTNIGNRHFNGDLSAMFNGCAALTAVDFTGMNTAYVTDMSNMFKGCAALTTLDLSPFNTGRVRSMGNMFNGCTLLESVFVSSVWTTASVSGSTNMFFGCTSIKGEDGTTYDASSVDKTRAHNGDGGYLRVGTDVEIDPTPYVIWCADNTTLYFLVSTRDLVAGSKFTPDGADTPVTITNVWNSEPGSWTLNHLTWRNTVKTVVTDVVIEPSFAQVSPATTLCWFYECGKLEHINGLEYLNTANSQSMENMFNGCTSLQSLDLSRFSTANATNLSGMFSGCTSLTALDLASFNTANVTNMAGMFNGCTLLQSVNVGGFNTAKVTSMSNMFKDCAALATLDLSTFNTAQVYNFTGMFSGCTALRTLTLGSAFVTRYASLSYMFNGCASLQSIDLSGFNTDEATSLSHLFAGCAALTTLDLSTFNTSSVTDMSGLFSGCAALTALDLTMFTTASVTTMSGMFAGCAALTTLDLHTFQTNRVTDMSRMFDGDSQLESVFVSNMWVTGSVNASDDMFAGCTSITGEDGTTYDAGEVDVTKAHYDTGGYLREGETQKLDYPTAYALYCADNHTLYFLYTDQMLLNGMKFKPEGSDTKHVITWYTTGSAVTSTGNNRPNWYSYTADIEHVVFESSFSNVRPKSLAYWFFGCSSLSDITGWENLKTAEVTNMRFLFANCRSLTTLDFSHFNTMKVTAMEGTFQNCSALTSLDLSNFITDKVTDMDDIFNGCSSIVTIYVSSHWTTANLRYGSDMFEGCVNIVGQDGTTYDPDITDSTRAHYGAEGYLTYGTEPQLDATPCVIYCAENQTAYFLYTTQAYGAGGTFTPAGSDTPLTITKVELGNDAATANWAYHLNAKDMTTAVIEPSYAQANLTSLKSWFARFEQLQTVSGLQYLSTENVNSMAFMFQGCNALENMDVSQLNTAHVTDMEYMFGGCENLKTIDLSAWSTGQLEDMSRMFNDCVSLESVNFAGWNTANVIDMEGLFTGCEALTSIDLSAWNTANVQDMGRMFAGCVSLESVNIANFNTAKVQSIDRMFSECQSLTALDLSHFDTGTVSSMEGVFDGCTALQTLNISGWNTGNVETMEDMFRDCTALGSIDVSRFNTQSVENLCGMFYGCQNIESLDLSHFNTDNVTDMDYMFLGCSRLTTLDLSTFNTSKVMYMDNLFGGCSLLESVFVSSTWTTAAATSSDDMFLGCTSITGEDGTTYDAAVVDKTRAHNLAEGYLRIGTDAVIEPTPMAVFSTADNTLYFFVGTTPVVNGGTCTLPGTTTRFMTAGAAMGEEVTNTATSTPRWITAASIAAMEKVVFDASFDDIHPLSTYGWFFRCAKLSAFEGLQYFHTDLSENMGYMFNECSALSDIDLSGFDTSSATDMQYMFYGVKAQGLDLSGFNTANVTNMRYMFAASSLVALDLSSFNTAKVQTMSRMFANCTSLRAIDLSAFDTGEVTDMALMFYNCGSLEKLELSSFNTEKVTVTQGMFYNDEMLVKVFVGDEWTMDAVNNSSQMFSYCGSLVGQDGTRFNTAYTDAARAHYGEGGYLRHHATEYAVTIPQSGIGTFSADEAVIMPEGLEAYYCTDYSEGGGTVLARSYNSTVIPEATGVILRGTPGETYTLTVTNEEAEPVNADNLLKAVTVPTHVPYGTTQMKMTDAGFLFDAYQNFMLKSGTFIAIADADQDTKMPANKAYLSVFVGTYDPNSTQPDEQPANITIVWDETTGIDHLPFTIDNSQFTIDNGSQSQSDCYDLQGRPVKSPTKGIYIKDGKKVLVK